MIACICFSSAARACSSALLTVSVTGSLSFSLNCAMYLSRDAK
jgi:hypothetical protein